MDEDEDEDYAAAPPVKLISSKDTLVNIDVCGHSFSLQQRPASGSHGKVVWEGAVSLAKYMEFNPKQFCHSKLRGKRVIELGSGCGLVGLVMSSMGCDVLLTDLEEVLPLLVANVDTNAPSACGSTSGSGAPSSWGRARCQVLQWGVDDPSPIAAEAGPFDYILGSDVVYSERLVPILMDTIRALAQPKTTILLANEFRCSVVSEVFLSTAREHFHVRKIPPKRQHPDRVNPYMLLFELKLKG